MISNRLKLNSEKTVYIIWTETRQQLDDINTAESDTERSSPIRVFLPSFVEIGKVAVSKPTREEKKVSILPSTYICFLPTENDNIYSISIYTVNRQITLNDYYSTLQK